MDDSLSTDEKVFGVVSNNPFLKMWRGRKKTTGFLDNSPQLGVRSFKVVDPLPELTEVCERSKVSNEQSHRSTNLPG